jgi:hypothetical protein
MEYMIILVLFIFLIIIILIKQIRTINKFKSKQNNLKSIFQINNYNKYLLFPQNPVILYLYDNILTSLKSINKYDYKAYIIFTKIKTSSEDQLFLDWISYTGGIIRMCIDTCIKMIKKNEEINSSFVNNVAKLKLYYSIIYKNPNLSRLDKNLTKYVPSRKIRTSRLIYNLFFINEILLETSDKFYKSLSSRSSLSNHIKKIIKTIDNKNNYYLYNSVLNNRLDKKYLQTKSTIFAKSFNY